MLVVTLSPDAEVVAQQEADDLRRKTTYNRGQVYSSFHWKNRCLCHAQVLSVNRDSIGGNWALSSFLERTHCRIEFANKNGKHSSEASRPTVQVKFQLKVNCASCTLQKLHLHRPQITEPVFHRYWLFSNCATPIVDDTP